MDMQQIPPEMGANPQQQPPQGMLPPQPQPQMEQPPVGPEPMEDEDRLDNIVDYALSEINIAKKLKNKKA